MGSWDGQWDTRASVGGTGGQSMECPMEQWDGWTIYGNSEQLSDIFLTHDKITAKLMKCVHVQF